MATLGQHVHLLVYRRRIIVVFAPRRLHVTPLAQPTRIFDSLVSSRRFTPCYRHPEHSSAPLGESVPVELAAMVASDACLNHAATVIPSHVSGGNVSVYNVSSHRNASLLKRSEIVTFVVVALKNGLIT